MAIVVAAGALLSWREPPAGPRLDIVFMGNSITHGSTLADPLHQAPPVHTGAYLNGRRGLGRVRFSNQGVSGYTTVNFLPGGKPFTHVEDAARAFADDDPGLLVFSIMLGTNDSAEDGPLGSPVAPGQYRKNLQAIIDRLLEDFPACLVVIQRPIWYSPTTYNGARYLQEGLNRLQSYFPEIDTLVRHYAETAPGHVFRGDTRAFDFFRKHYRDFFTVEQGHRGTFYLHPNAAGAVRLGGYWGRAIEKIIKKQGKAPVQSAPPA